MGDEGCGEGTSELHLEDGHEHQDRSAHERHHNAVVAKPSLGQACEPAWSVGSGHPARITP